LWTTTADWTVVSADAVVAWTAAGPAGQQGASTQIAVDADRPTRADTPSSFVGGCSSQTAAHSP
jgi:hypothetical protein